MTRSLWLDRRRVETRVPPEVGPHYDTVVVGAGLTGVCVALLLARAGQSVLVLEARQVGAGTTGNTTAKASLLQGTRLSSVARRQPTEAVEAYVDGSRQAQAWLRDYCRAGGVDVQVRDAYTYATTAEGEAAAEKELEACAAADLDVSWRDDLELPFPVRGAVWLPDQLQFDPMELLGRMTDDLQQQGGAILEDTRVRTVRRHGSVLTVTCDDVEVTADRVILATGIPVLDRGGFFARLEPLRSYAAAFDVPAMAPLGMYLSADSPTRSIRSTPDGARELLLTGGNGHPVGRHPSPARQVEDLTAWTTETFTGATRTHWWSAQDYHSVDELPFVGPLTPADRGIYVATGYDKWGMTSAVAAAHVLSARFLSERLDWADQWDSWRLRELKALGSTVRINAAVAVQLSAGWAGSEARRPEDDPDEGTGVVGRQGLRPVATCKDQGVVHRLSGVCPHLKGVVRWNDAEKSWDCPLHGSRFAADGTLLEGPATRGLEPITSSRPAQEP